MALATDLVAGEVILTGDIHGSADPLAPELTPTGVAAGTYVVPTLVVDEKGRVLWSADDEIDVDCATISTHGTVIVGSNLVVNTGIVSLPPATGSVLGAVSVGGGFAVAGDGTISFDLPESSTIVPGLVKVPASGNIDVDVSGNISIPITSGANVGVVQVGTGLEITGDVLSIDDSLFSLATTGSAGVIQVGNGLDIDGSGVLSVDPTETPVATTGSAGVIQVGNGLDVDANGVVTVDTSEFSVDPATTFATGVIQVGNGLDVDGSGLLTVNESELNIANATNISKGVVQVGSNVDVTAGTISVPEATAVSKGVVQVGNNLFESAGVLRPNVATNTITGVVRPLNTNHLVVDGTGGLDLAPTVPTSNTQNVWTKTQYVASDSLVSGSTVTPDANDSEVFVITLDQNITLNAILNTVSGGKYYIVFKQDAIGGRTVTFDGAYNIQGDSQVSSTANSYSVLSLVAPTAGNFLGYLTTNYL